jgi:hypothetical protein
VFSPVRHHEKTYLYLPVVNFAWQRGFLRRQWANADTDAEIER